MDQPQIITSAPVKPSKKKIIAASIVGILIGIWIVFSVLVELEAFPQKETLYSEGQRRALIIFHPSWKYHFQEDLTSAFAKGLHVAGWAVDRITTGAKDLTDFYSYDMYVFGTNTYYWRPDLPTKRFLSGIDLRGKPAVGIVSGPGYTERAEAILKELLVRTNASAVAIHAFSLWSPNKESLIPNFNRQAAVESALKLGEEIGKELRTIPMLLPLP
mgnify:CR=1 FL=1